MLDCRISIRLGPVLWRKVQQEAKERHTTMSAVVREVLEDYCASRKPQARNRSSRSRRSF